MINTIFCVHTCGCFYDEHFWTFLRCLKGFESSTETRKLKIICHCQHETIKSSVNTKKACFYAKFYISVTPEGRMFIILSAKRPLTIVMRLSSKASFFW